MITPGDETLPPTGGFVEDHDLARALSQLSQALADPLRVRIVAALMQLRHASPVVLASLLDQPVDQISAQARQLERASVVAVNSFTPDPAPVETFLSLAPALTSALPDTAEALARSQQQPPSGNEPVRTPPDEPRLAYRTLLNAPGREFTSHRESLVDLAHALADERRIDILAYLAAHDHASADDIAHALELARDLVDQHLRLLADVYAIRPLSEQPPRWTLAQPMRTALGGFYDYLVTLRELRATATPSPDASDDAAADHNGDNGPE